LRGRSFSGSDYSSSSDTDENYGSSSDSGYNASSVSRDYADERSSPSEHTVQGHGQHYHTKEGVIWKEKEPYLRGGKHDRD
jgi:hypothetical protein